MQSKDPQVFSFLHVFNIFKNTQNLCAAFVAHWENFRVSHKTKVEIPISKSLSAFTCCLNVVIILHGLSHLSNKTERNQRPKSYATN
jgi:hypothetical protein